MKNVMTYVNPDKRFDEEHEVLARIQVDNCLSLGWRAEDIVMATNFDFEYRGVESVRVGDGCYCRSHWPATKIYVLVELFERGLMGDGLHWYHDFDCYQLVPFSVGLPDMGRADLGLTNYGRMPRLCSASMFFTGFAQDIFDRLKFEIYKSRTNEERVIARMVSDPALEGGIKLLNITYAFHRFNIRSCYPLADKPIRAAHFHLTPDKYEFFVEGKNKLGIKLIPDRLIDIFTRHGWTREKQWQLATRP
jgi:hypothetical protein